MLARRLILSGRSLVRPASTSSLNIEKSQPKRPQPSLYQNGLKQYMRRVYGYTGLGVGTSMAVASVASTIPQITDSWHGFAAGAIMAFASIPCIAFSKPTIVGDRTINSPFRKTAFMGLSTGLGLTLAPLVALTNSIDPMILPEALAISTGIFGTCGYISTRVQDETMMEWKAPLSVGIFSLLGVQLAGLACIGLGYSNAASLLHNVDIYGGIGLFTLMSIYSSYSARKSYQEGTPDHLGCAVNLYLDFMNLLIRFMELLAKSKSKD